MAEGSGAVNVRLVAELHRRQAEMYAGGSVEPVAELLAEELPGSNSSTERLALVAGRSAGGRLASIASKLI